MIKSNEMRGIRYLDSALITRKSAFKVRMIHLLRLQLWLEQGSIFVAGINRGLSKTHPVAYWSSIELLQPCHFFPDTSVTYEY